MDYVELEIGCTTAFSVVRETSNFGQYTVKEFRQSGAILGAFYQALIQEGSKILRGSSPRRKHYFEVAFSILGDPIRWLSEAYTKREYLKSRISQLERLLVD